MRFIPGLPNTRPILRRTARGKMRALRRADTSRNEKFTVPATAWPLPEPAFCPGNRLLFQDFQSLPRLPRLVGILVPGRIQKMLVVGNRLLFLVQGVVGDGPQKIR